GFFGGLLKATGGTDGVNTLQSIYAESFNEFISSAELAGQPIEVQTRFLVSLLEGRWMSRGTDEFFDRVWSETESRPDLRRNLKVPRYVDSLTFKDTKEKLAKWQLNQLYGLEQRAIDIQHRKTPVPTREQVRPELTRIATTLQEQFPSVSNVKNSVI